MSSSTKHFLPRVIPVLLLKGRDNLVKTTAFSQPVYVGDPLNAVKIFNEKEVDELILLDIEATKENRQPDYEYINQIATECFMPVTYGGGVNSIESFKKVIESGVEKVALNSSALANPDLIKAAANHFGSSSVVVALDVKKDFFGRSRVYQHALKKTTEKDPTAFSLWLESIGAGEILLQSVDQDGTRQGYDTALIHKVASAVNIPVIACGGAGTVQHFSEALLAGASAVAAGSKFIFWGKHKAVLINYLSDLEIQQLLHSPQ